MLIVAVPIFANIQALLGMRKNQELTVIEIIAYFIVLSFLYEVVFPWFLSYSFSDPYDILAYGLGGIFLIAEQFLEKLILHKHS